MDKLLLKPRKARGSLISNVDSPHNAWDTDTNDAKSTKSISTKIHQCKICGLVNNNAWGLTIHMRRHSREKKYKCEICSSSFVNNYELSKHMNSGHIREKKYQCRFCTRKFINPGSKYYHEDTHGVLQHKCKFCDEVFSTQSKRRNHQREAHRTGEHSCKYCLRNFASKEFLKSHISMSHFKTVTCSECDKLFYDKKELQEHKKELHKVEKVRNMKRRVTQQKSNERNLYEDVDLNIKTYVFHCSICSEEFNFKVDLNSHIESVHPDERDNVYKFVCIICHKSFDSKNKLRGHMIGHGPKTHICPHCDYKTARDQDLDKHIRVIHDLEKRFKCSMCSKYFIHRSTFVAHKMKHAKAKFECDICGSTFNMKNQLAQHRKLKHYVESTICDQCGKQFMNPLSLKGHIKIFHNKPNSLCLCNCCGIMIKLKDISIHLLTCTKTSLESVKSKMKGPTCDYCYVTFSTGPDALYHYKELHPNSIFSCKYCGVNFLSMELRKKHEIKHELKKRPPQRIHKKIFTLDEKRTMKSLNILSDDYNIYECFACGASFATNEDLSDHLETDYCLNVSEEAACNQTSMLGESYQKDNFIMYKVFKDRPFVQGQIINEFFINISPKPSFSETLYIAVKKLPFKYKNPTTSKVKLQKKATSIQKKPKIKLERDKDLSDKFFAITKSPIYSTGLEDLIKQEILGNDKQEALQNNNNPSLSPPASISLTNNIVSANHLIELLQQKTVSVGGSAFLPFSELIEKLKLFSGVEVND